MLNLPVVLLINCQNLSQYTHYPLIVKFFFYFASLLIICRFAFFFLGCFGFFFSLYTSKFYVVLVSTLLQVFFFQ